MKLLDGDAFERARTFVAEQGRELDRRLLSHCFDDGPAAAVVEELSSYQNEVTVQSPGEQDSREDRGRCYEGTTEGVGGNSEGAGCWRTAAWQAPRR